MKQAARKITAAFISVIMAVSVFALPLAAADRETNPFDFTIPGASAEGEGYTWNENTNTLKLNGFSNPACDIKLPENAVIKLAGESCCNSIAGEGALTFSGGRLNVDTVEAKSLALTGVWLETKALIINGKYPVFSDISGAVNSVLFMQGCYGRVFGSYTVNTSCAIPENSELTVPEGAQLTVNNGALLTIPESSKLIVIGTLAGQENLDGEFEVEQPVIRPEPKVKLEIAGTPAYGSTVKLKVTVEQQGIQPRAALTQAEAAGNTVTFYCDGTQISSKPLVGNKAEASVTLRGKTFNAGRHMLKIECIVGEGLNAQTVIYTQQINIQKGEVTAPSETLDSLTAVKGQILGDVELPPRWRWKNPETLLDTLGENSYIAIYTPADMLNYNEAEVRLTVVVTDEAPEVPAIPETGVNLPLMLVLSALALIAAAGITVKLLIKK